MTMRVTRGNLVVREPKRPDESAEDFAKREEAHWAKVAENEAKLLAARRIAGRLK